MRLFCYLTLAVCTLAPLLSFTQATQSFEGTWQQAIKDSSPKSKDKTPKHLKIDFDGDKLMVAMTGPSNLHKIEVTYQIGGPQVTYTGLDGDEFHIKVRREGDGLIFEGIEIERGAEREIYETWVLRDKNEGRVLVDTENTKDANERPRSITEYERVDQ